MFLSCVSLLAFGMDMDCVVDYLNIMGMDVLKLMQRNI